MDFWGVLASAGAVVFVVFFIGLCIFVHELGHFLAAKVRGLHIDAFSIGFKTLWHRKINGVDYRIGYLPFGGYVELPQVDATDEVPKAADGTELPRATPLDRMITAFCGPLFNILFGLLLGCVVWYFGVPQDTPKMRVVEVRTVDDKGPEYAAGLRPGDRIVKLNGEPIFDTWAGFVNKLQLAIGEVELTVERDGGQRTIRYTPAVNPNAPSRLRHEQIAYPFFTARIPIVLYPQAGAPAARAGLKPGDQLLSINGQTFEDFVALQLYLDYADGPLEIEVLRNGREEKFTVQPEPLEEVPPEAVRYLLGVTYFPGDAVCTVRGLQEGFPAQQAGLQIGDQILRVGGEELATPTALPELLAKHKDEPVELRIKRGDEELSVTVAAREVRPWTIGVEIALRDYPTPIQQFVNTLDLTWKSVRGMGVGLANKLGLTQQSSTIQPRHMSGILGMSVFLFTMVRTSSLMLAIYFVVLISFALAIFNLLPLPVLDGGHIAFALIELVIRRPLPTVVIRYLSIAFVTLLIGLMVYVTYYDILRTYHLFAPEPDAELPPAAEAGEPVPAAEAEPAP